MFRSYSVNCKRCGGKLVIDTDPFNNPRDSAKKSRRCKIVCPRCHFAETYLPEDLT